MMYLLAVTVTLAPFIAVALLWLAMHLWREYREENMTQGPLIKVNCRALTADMATDPRMSRLVRRHCPRKDQR